MNDAARNAMNVGALLALWAACVIGMGAIARLAVWLFCLGYGC